MLTLQRCSQLDNNLLITTKRTDMVQDPNDEEEDLSFDERLEQLENDFPEYSEESKRAGAFIGLDFPYVPGDPGL